MQFSINGWHPVASHLLCIITGVALSNFLGYPVQTSAPPPKGQMTFVLPGKYFSTPLPANSPKIAVNVYRNSSSGATCRIFKTGLYFFQQSESFRFSTRLAEQQGLGLLVKEIRINHKFRVDRHNEKTLVCENHPRVSYGS